MAEVYHFTRFILIRHAQARSKDGIYRNDTPLSRLGVRQARRLSTGLRPVWAPSVLYSSPLARALQTAEPLAKRLGLEVDVDDRLAEFQMDPAPLDPNASSLLWRPEQRGMEHGETIGEFFHRVGRFCGAVCDRHPDGVVAIVTHAGVIDATCRWALDVPPDKGWTFEAEVPNASVSLIEVWPRGRSHGGAPRITVLHSIGEVGHLGRHSSPL